MTTRLATRLVALSARRLATASASPPLVAAAAPAAAAPSPAAAAAAAAPAPERRLNQTQVDFGHKVAHTTVRGSWDAYQYCMGVHAALSNDKVLDACGLIEEARKKKLSVNASFHGLMTYLARKGRSTATLAVFNYMKKCAVPLDSTMYSVLLRALATGKTVNRREQSERYLNEMIERGIAPTSFVYRSLLTLAARDGHTDIALRSITQMKQEKGALTPNDFRLAIQAFQKVGDRAGGLSLALFACSQLGGWCAHMVRPPLQGWLQGALATLDPAEIARDGNAHLVPVLRQMLQRPTPPGRAGQGETVAVRSGDETQWVTLRNTDRRVFQRTRGLVTTIT